MRKLQVKRRGLRVKNSDKKSYKKRLQVSVNHGIMDSNKKPRKR